MSNVPLIRFGTDGWRALIARDYTFENVRICAAAVAAYLKEEGLGDRGAVVGYDTRFGSPEFAAEAAAVIAAEGVPTYLSDQVSPTPVVSYSILHQQAGGGAIITASHNSGLWNGFKYKPDYAGSAPPEIVSRIEHHIDALQAAGGVDAPGRGAPQPKLVDMKGPYLANLATAMDLDAIAASGLRIGIDAMHGAGAGYVTAALDGTGADVQEMRAERNPAFPGMKQPEPIEPNLGPSIEAARAGRFDVVLANDGDADRLGVLDENGTFIDTLSTFSLLCLHQLDGKGLRGPIIRSLTQSAMVDKLAARYDVPVHVTPVGFKFVGPAMITESAVAAGEESGGYAFQGNIPERDGIFSGLLFVELMVRTGKRASELVNLLHETVGEHAYDRLDVDLAPDDPKPDTLALAARPPASIAGLRVTGTDTMDGVRYVLEDGFWGLIRPSGTEPLLRIYAEGDSPQRVAEMLQDLRGLAGA
ncbi:MAG: phosphoglucomutase/phosphomannomutase family protein [Chloroflexota bacterium]|nr:phosphoglucomutase/phosphomannomutase family protein [Chloroflexota bacterium]MDE2884222.1 phosphoglucomutase/phosphomannomutase family protein [Chloroflexota bacterium]